MKIKNYILKIKELNPNQRPREKLINQGLTSLNTKELLALILTTGSKKEEVMSMASRLIKDYGEKSLIKETNPKLLAEKFLLPLNKACQLIACLEIGRRFLQKNQTDQPVLRCPQDVFNYLSDMGKLKKEQLRGLYLNSHYRLIYDEVISLGTLNSNLAHPREIFKPAIYQGASAIIIAHNHPSGETKASQADIAITKKIQAAGQLLEIELLDHLIITDKKFLSLI